MTFQSWNVGVDVDNLSKHPLGHNFPDDEIWPETLRGMAPTMARHQIVERTRKDEFDAALTGNENIYKREVLGGQDISHVDIVSTRNIASGR
jgi:hypothetical protein